MHTRADLLYMRELLQIKKLLKIYRLILSAMRCRIRKENIPSSLL